MTATAPNGMTPISVAWPGPLPRGCRVVRLKHLARLYAGGTPDRKNPDYWNDGTIPWLNSGAVNQRLITAPSTYITEDALHNSSAKWIPKGALVMALAGQGKTKGMVAQLAIASTCNQSMAAIVPGPRVKPRFLLWWLAANYETIRNLAGGELRDGLNLEILGDIPCPDPGPSFQSAVAEYLDRETSGLDALIGARQRMMELLEERWEAFRAASVSGATSQSERVRSGLRWLGSVPDNWSIERLKFLARMESGHTPDKKVEAYWVDCSIPWITLNDVGLLEHQWSITQPINAINELGMANSAAHILPEGTVVVSRDATVGRSAILGRPMTVSQHFVGWIPGPRLMPEYLLHVLRGPMQRHFATLTAGATIATIGMPELNDLVVPVPPIDEQKRIIAELRSAEDRFNRTRCALDTQVGLLQERRQSLITAAVTGQLDIPEAA